MNVPGCLKGQNLRTAKWLRKENRFVNVTTAGSCDRTIRFKEDLGSSKAEEMEHKENSENLERITF